MSYETTPDAWVIVRIITPDSLVYKVLAGWHGGYLSSSSWQLNSGIAKYSVDNSSDDYLFNGYSGSVYRCHKKLERFTGYTGSIFESLRKQIEEKGDGFKMEHISMEDFVNEFTPLEEYDGQ